MEDVMCLWKGSWYKDYLIGSLKLTKTKLIFNAVQQQQGFPFFAKKKAKKKIEIELKNIVDVKLHKLRYPSLFGFMIWGFHYSAKVNTLKAEYIFCHELDKETAKKKTTTAKQWVKEIKKAVK